MSANRGAVPVVPCALPALDPRNHEWVVPDEVGPCPAVVIAPCGREYPDVVDQDHAPVGPAREPLETQVEVDVLAHVEPFVVAVERRERGASTELAAALSYAQRPTEEAPTTQP